MATHLNSVAGDDRADGATANEAALAAVWTSASSGVSIRRDLDRPRALFLPVAGGWGAAAGEPPGLDPPLMEAERSVLSRTEGGDAEESPPQRRE